MQKLQVTLTFEAQDFMDRDDFLESVMNAITIKNLATGIQAVEASGNISVDIDLSDFNPDLN